MTRSSDTRAATGLCATGQWDPDLWFKKRHWEVDRARSICARCPILDACRERALKLPLDPKQHQVVGGLTNRELLKIRGGTTYLRDWEYAQARHRVAL